jgi:hypothetical protein
MALKQKIDKAAFDALSDVLKAEYKLVGDSYVLDTDEASAAATALAAERDSNAALKRKLDEIDAQAAKDRKDAQDKLDEEARKNKDVNALEASWQGKLNDAVAEKDKEITGLKKQIDDLLVHGKAEALAAKISTVPELLAPLISTRLRASVDADGKPTTRVLVNNELSALSLDDLEKEFLANPKYAGIIRGTSASGGGANETLPGGGANGKKISEMTEAERVAAYRANPTDFNRRKDAGL